MSKARGVPPRLTTDEDEMKGRARILKADCTLRPHLFNIFCFNWLSCIWFVARTFFLQPLFIFSWIALLRLLRRQSCLLPVDMDAPESTFVNHCRKFVIFPVHILGLCFLLPSSLFIERSAWEGAVLLALNLHRDWFVCPAFPWTKIGNGDGCACTFF